MTKLKLRSAGRQKYDLDVDKLIIEYNAGATIRDLAAKYHVGKTTIFNRLHEACDKQK